MWKDNVISFKDTPLTEVVKVLNRWYNVNFKIEDEQASKYVYTLTSIIRYWRKCFRIWKKLRR